MSNQDLPSGGPPADAGIVTFVADVTRWYYDNDDGFRDDFSAAVAGVQPLPPGTDPAVTFDWGQATIERLTGFFEDWYSWEPDLATGLDFIQKFSWLYHDNDAGRRFVMRGRGLQMTLDFVTIKARWMDSAASRTLVAKWTAELGATMEQYVVPAGGFRSFNEFFARTLKGGRRPISRPQDDSVVVSPADAIVNMIDDDLTLDRPLQVKTQRLSVRNLLDDSPLADSFEGGTAVSCILMPTVYHRFHSPVNGQVVESNEDVAGAYFGIDDFPRLLHGGNVGYGYDYSVFEHFRRGYLIIETATFGYVGMVPVGLNTIASVVFSERFKRVVAGDQPVPIDKGDEVGYFQYGGSLNILIFEPGCLPSLQIPQGQMIGTLTEPTAPRPSFVF